MSQADYPYPVGSIIESKCYEKGAVTQRIIFKILGYQYDEFSGLYSASLFFIEPEKDRGQAVTEFLTRDNCAYGDCKLIVK